MDRSGGRVCGPRASEMSILVVDDDEAVASTAASYLRRLDGVTVRTETDPADAVELVAGGDFDAVVSDYEMPAMDGLTLLDAVLERDSSVAFVLFTACRDEDIPDRVSARGGAYVPKGGHAGGFERLAEWVRARLETDAARSNVAATD
ncbi:hypothetical protein BRC64_12430 [Halobacteriales archaeon QH_10_67_22]|nr:MAG: hypothetical protein BRC64_12430 [Halobacteriales archaeon QH_10_67_22]